MYAVVTTGGKQFRVREGDTVEVEKLDVAADETVDLRPVLLVDDDGGVTTGADALAGAAVRATVVEHGKGKRITVFTYRNKTGYRRKHGHRQPFTRLRIDAIDS